MRFGHLLGTHPAQGDNYFDTVLELAQISEAVGLDAVFYSDHVQFVRMGIEVRGLRRLAKLAWWFPPLKGLTRWANALASRTESDPRRAMAVLECFTTLGAVAAATQRIRLGALVAGVPYRNPALLAKINTTLDIISHGRLIVGLGAGWYEEEFRAYGWPFPSVRRRLEQLEDAVRIVDAMMREPRASVVGKHASISGAINFPPPIQKPRPPILIGGSGERRTLRLVAQYADYCNLFGDPATVARKIKVLQAHCKAVNRPFEEIICSNFVSILIAKTQVELNRKRRQFPPWLGTPIVGTPTQVIETLQTYQKAGIGLTIFNFPDAHTLEPLYLFAETVMPAFHAETPR